ncbi:MAG: hypothetical protein V7L05_32410 [Nostoc sp.]|uniref:hypothetical protein n=1 Tax=Nostoc sp. TaxID=1180 RepID=UPI002FFBDFE9
MSKTMPCLANAQCPMPNAQYPIQKKLTYSRNLDTYGKAHYLQRKRPSRPGTRH